MPFSIYCAIRCEHGRGVLDLNHGGEHNPNIINMFVHIPEQPLRPRNIQLIGEIGRTRMRIPIRIAIGKLFYATITEEIWSTSIMLTHRGLCSHEACLSIPQQSCHRTLDRLTSVGAKNEAGCGTNYGPGEQQARWRLTTDNGETAVDLRDYSGQVLR